MSNEFFDKLSFVLHNENKKNKIVLPHSVKRFLFLLHFGNGYREAVKYNMTVCFTSVNVDGEECEDPRIVVQHKRLMFFYSSKLCVRNRQTVFEYSWNNLYRKPMARANRALCKYVTAIFWRQLYAILYALDFSAIEALAVAQKIAEGSMITDWDLPVARTSCPANNYEIRVTAYNNLPIGGPADGFAKYIIEIQQEGE